MKRRGPCVHQQPLYASVTAPTTTAPVRGRSVTTAACLRLYAEAQELRDHKELIYSKFGLQKVPVRKATMAGRTPTSTRSSVKIETSTANSGANRGTKSSASTAVKQRASVHGTGSRPATGTIGSPGRDRRSSLVYVPPGGRSPTATTMQQVFAKTYSLQSTVESRAAVAPRRKVSTTKKPPSPKTVPASRRPTSAASPSKEATKARRISSANTFVGRGAPLTAHQRSQQSTTQQKTMNKRPSIAASSPEVTTPRGGRASMISPRSGALGRRRPSTALMQQPPPKTRTASTIFQVQPQRQEPVLIQVSRRTSSPIMSPGAGGGRRRPSVAPIGPVASPVRGGGGALEAGSTVSPSGSSSSPRASFIRREHKLEKLQEQVNVLKASLGISDEDLMWKVESSKGNAFLAADKHLAACEERYDRLVFEMQELSQPARCADEDKVNVMLASKLRSLEKQAQHVAELRARTTSFQADLVQTKKSLLTVRVEAELQRAKQDASAAAAASELEQLTIKRLESIKEELLAAQQQLKAEQGALQTLLEWLGAETDRFGASVAAEDVCPSPVVSEQTLEAKRSLLYTLRTIPECTQGSERLSTLCSQATQLAAKITASRAHNLKRTEAELERTMRDVEVWKTRREQAKEFGDEMRKREAAWQARQRAGNDEALALLRTFIPVDIAEISVETLIARAQGGGTLYTYDLAAHLKTNRFLHWLVTHEDDVARANFLAVESASFFMDFSSYDIHELRALARVLPETFAFDKDGRKNAWRTSFIEHVRQLTAQQQRETIKAGWDPVKRARRDAHLPELTARQQLNPIFCYPTDAEIDSRLHKFDRQRVRLESKRTRLNKLDAELIPQAKAEYVAVAEDVRNEDLQRSFGKSTLIALREEAKQQHLALCKEREVVKGELAHGDRAWAAMTPSFEQYQAEVARVRALDPETRNAARIRGPFPSTVELQPRERAAFKKLSVEEEAEARKLELDSAIARRSHDIQEVAVVEEIPVVASRPSALVVETTALTEAEVEALRLMQLEDKQSSVVTEPVVSTGLAVPAPVLLARGFKRVKSLQVAVGVLQFLEKDFCSPKRAMRGKEGSLLSACQKPQASESIEPAEKSAQGDEQVVQTPRFSRSLPPTPKASTKDIDSRAPKPPAPVVVAPKSKALLKLLEARKAEAAGGSPKAAAVPASSPFGGGQVNFLGELQTRFQRKPSSSDAVATGGNDDASTQAGARKPMSFLDELKSASTRTAGKEEAPSTDAPPKKPMNFLEELKIASTRKATITAAAEASVGSASPRTVTAAPPTPRIVMEELKARARAAS